MPFRNGKYGGEAMPPFGDKAFYVLDEDWARLMVVISQSYTWSKARAYMQHQKGAVKALEGEKAILFLQKFCYFMQITFLQI